MEKEKIINEIEETVLFTEEEAEKIATENIGLIHHIIGTLSYNNFDYTELYDVGLYGYAKAIKSFNKKKDILFSTYACNCIRNEILLFIKKETKHLVNDISLNKQIANGDHKNLLLEDIITDDNSYINNVEKLMINEDTCKILKKVIKNLDYDLYEIIDIIEKVVPKNKDIKIYNISFGPPGPILDDSISRFTYALDKLAYEEDVLFVVAVGNDGENILNRIQAPADLVNGLGIGAYT